MGVEIELKLRWAGGRPPAPDEFAPCGAPPPRRQWVESLYYDTPEGALWRRGVAYRVRRLDGAWMQTVKARGVERAGVSEREEVETPLEAPEPDPGRLPAEGAALVGADAGRLVPVFATVFERHEWRWEPEPGLRVALALDRGEIRVDDGRSEPLAEVEVELLEGAPESLYRIGRELAARWPLVLEWRSKAERGYALAGLARRVAQARPWEVPTLPARCDAAEAGARVARSLALHLEDNRPAALAGDPEGIHQVRLALRRLRTLPRILPVAWAAEAEVTERLAALARALGPVRDLDVLAEGWERVVRACPGAEALAAAVAAERETAWRVAAAALDAPPATWLVLAVLAAPEAEAAGPLARHQRRVLAALALRVRERGHGFGGLDLEARHRLRIAVKRLRLAAQLFAGAEPGRRTRRYLRAVARLSDAMGALQDIAAARGLAARLGSPPELCAWLAGREEGWEAAARHAWRAWRRVEPFWH